MHGFPRLPRQTPAAWTRALAHCVIPLTLLLSACDRGTAREAQPERSAAALQRRSPIADSVRERRNAMLVKRPDTLGMRADSSRVLGDPSARVWVIVTSDFQCQRCRDFARNVLAPFRNEFVAAGSVRLAFVNFPQDRNFNARFAASAALCAGTVGRFWAMHDSLFAQQHVWERMPDPRPYLESLAAAAGVPAAVQSDCMTRNRMLLRLTSDIEQSRESGVSEVPTVFVGSRRLSADDLNYAGLARAVKQGLAEGRQ